MDKKNNQIAHRRIVAGREILRKYGQNNNSPATSSSQHPLCPTMGLNHEPSWTEPTLDKCEVGLSGSKSARVPDHF
jgi:hypothetical protein